MGKTAVDAGLILAPMQRMIAIGIVLIGIVAILGAENKNATTERLFDSARQVSDFRSSSKPFRLRAEIKLVRGGTKDGKYVEVWQSPTQWRRELTIGAYKQIQVSDPNDERHSWVIEPSEMAGFGRVTLEFLQLNDLEPNSWKIAKVFDRDNHGLQLTCVETKENIGEKRTICFDKLTKTLRSVKYSSLGPHSLHEYGDYIAFGLFSFPGHIKSESPDDGLLDIVVTELAPETSSDPSLFAKPPNSERRPVCRVAAPPRVLSSDNKYPAWAAGNQKAVFGLVVGTDGRPHNLQMIDSTDQNYASTVQHIVQSWVFAPSVCQGEPIPAWFEVTMRSGSLY